MLVDLPELELINRLKKGEPKAFQYLFDRYWNELYLTALKKTGDENMAKDLVQEVFINFYNYRNNIRIKKSLSVYLKTMLKYQFLKQVKKAASNQQFQKEFLEFNKDSFHYIAFSATEYNELYEQIEVAVESLPPRCKEIFKKNRMEDQAIEDIATEMNISESTVRNQLTKATKIIQLELDKSVGLYLVWLWL